MTKLEEFVNAVETINDFCDKRGDCCGCPLNDYCVDIPTRGSCQAAIRGAMKCMEIIKSEEEKQ